MKGETPAPWFIEVDGQKQGPYTSQEITKLLMDGALKLESKIFDVSADQWKIAADVVPYLELGEAESPKSYGWQPPPKPIDLRDQHVVKLNSEQTSDIDYFALIGDQRKTSKQNKIKPESVVARKAAPILVQTYPTPAEPAQPPVSQEVEAAVVISLVGRITEFVRAHQKQIGAAAAFGFLFLGTYGVIRTLSDRKSREPAAAAPVAEKKEKERSKHVTANGPEEKLGSGRHRNVVQRGGVSHLNATAPSARIMPSAVNTPAPPQPTEDGETPREPAQFISSQRVDPNVEQGSNQNEGAVQAPGFIPPPAAPPPGVLQGEPTPNPIEVNGYSEQAPIDPPEPNQ